MTRFTLEKLCRRRYGDITQPFVINRNMQICKIAEFALAVRILRTLKRVNFLCHIKKKTHVFQLACKISYFMASSCRIVFAEPITSVGLQLSVSEEQPKRRYSISQSISHLHQNYLSLLLFFLNADSKNSPRIYYGISGSFENLLF